MLTLCNLWYDFTYNDSDWILRVNQISEYCPIIQISLWWRNILLIYMYGSSNTIKCDNNIKQVLLSYNLFFSTISITQFSFWIINHFVWTFYSSCYFENRAFLGDFLVNTLIPNVLLKILNAMNRMDFSPSVFLKRKKRRKDNNIVILSWHMVFSRFLVLCE